MATQTLTYPLPHQLQDSSSSRSRIDTPELASTSCLSNNPGPITPILSSVVASQAGEHIAGLKISMAAAAASTLEVSVPWAPTTPPQPLSPRKRASLDSTDGSSEDIFSSPPLIEPHSSSSVDDSTVHRFGDDSSMIPLSDDNDTCSDGSSNSPARSNGGNVSAIARATPSAPSQPQQLQQHQAGVSSSASNTYRDSGGAGSTSRGFAERSVSSLDMEDGLDGGFGYSLSNNLCT